MLCSQLVSPAPSYPKQISYCRFKHTNVVLVVIYSLVEKTISPQGAVVGDVAAVLELSTVLIRDRLCPVVMEL